MKKLIPILIVAVILVGGLFLLIPSAPTDGYIRIHIRANSNAQVDQDVKYLVKDKVVECITPLAKDITSFESMYAVLQQNLGNIKTCVDNELALCGYTYGSTIRLNREDFPTRAYEDLTLDAGIYDALIIELGEGVGDNWWCVAFPPLCFEQGGDKNAKPEYRSLIKEWLGGLRK